MRKHFIAVVAVMVAMVAFNSCSEKIDVAAPYKEYTIVAGLLDIDDTAHYIRITKAFLDNSKSAIDMAQEPDSSFYAILDVKVKEISSSGKITKVINLNRVDLNTEGYQKEDGDFFTSPNYAYKFTDKLNADNTYRLVITHTSGEADSAETPIITDKNVSGEFYVLQFDKTYPNTYELDFSDTLPSNSKKFNVTSPTTVGVLEGIMRIHWTNENATTGQITQDSADWHFASATRAGTSTPLEAKNTDLYAFMFTNIGVAPANTIRHIGHVDIFVYAGTPELISYQRVIALQNVGLTAKEIKPVYTNIKGNAVMGLFTSRGKRVSLDRAFTNETYNAFITSPRLAGLNIQP